MPDISAQLITQVLEAKNDNQSLNIIGGGTKQFMGRQTEGAPINLAQHSGVISYNPVELVLTVRAGTKLSEISQVLAENGQMLSSEPPQFGGDATVGGTLACNLSGPSRPWSGSLRDHVLGIKLINGKGEHLNFGGQVMKNVAGYDVSRLQAGAMGTLGVITEVSLKVMPIPEKTRTLCWDMNATEALHAMNRKSASPKPINAAFWHNGRLFVRLSGAADAVNATVAAWGGTELVDTIVWEQLKEHRLDYFTSDKPLWRFSINPTKALEIDDQAIIDWGGAQRWLKADADKADMEALAEQAGGQVQLFSGGNRQAEVMHTPSSPLQRINKHLKQSFDPAGIFNPGRLYSWM